MSIFNHYKPKAKANKEAPEHIEDFQLLGVVGLNVRAAKRTSDGTRVPNVWLQRVTFGKYQEEIEALMAKADAEGVVERIPEINFPLVDAKYAGIYGGNTDSWFKRVCGDMWTALLRKATILDAKTYSEESGRQAQAGSGVPF